MCVVNKQFRLVDNSRMGALKSEIHLLLRVALSGFRIMQVTLHITKQAWASPLMWGGGTTGKGESAGELECVTIPAPGNDLL